MNRQKLVTITLPVILILIAAQVASTEDIGIIDLYSSIDSADVTLHSGAHHTNITVDAELMLEEELLRREQFKIDETLPDTDITKVVSCDLKSPEDGFYITRVTFSMDGSVLETRYRNFSALWYLELK